MSYIDVGALSTQMQNLGNKRNQIDTLNGLITPLEEAITAAENALQDTINLAQQLIDTDRGTLDGYYTTKGIREQEFSDILNIITTLITLPEVP